ncbi:MAG: hypothetical protein WAK18_10470 [Nocardioidaceae bacterium]
MTRSKAIAISVVGIALFFVEALIEWPLEGPVVLKFDKQHGVHVSDLITLALLVALLVWTWRPVLRTTPPREPAATSPDR